MHRAPAGGGELVPEGLTEQAGQGARMWLGGSLLSWRRRGRLGEGGGGVQREDVLVCWAASPGRTTGRPGQIPRAPSLTVLHRETRMMAPSSLPMRRSSRGRAVT